MSFYQKTQASSSKQPSGMPPLTETRLSATALARASDLRRRTEENLQRRREQLAEAKRHNARGQNSVNIANMERKIRSIENGLRTGAVDRHQQQDVADATRNYEYAKAAENARLRASMGQQPQFNGRFVPPEIAGQIGDGLATPRIAQHRDNIRRDYKNEQSKRY